MRKTGLRGCTVRAGLFLWWSYFSPSAASNTAPTGPGSCCVPFFRVRSTPAHRAVKGATVTRPKEPMTVWMISAATYLYVQAGAGGLPPVQVGALLHHLVDGGGDVHGQVHHRPRGPDEDGGHKDLGQIQVGVAGVEQALRVLHHRPVDVKQVGEQHPQHTGDQNPQEGAGHRRPAPLVKAVHQGNDDHRVMASPTQMGFQPFRYRGTSTFHRVSTVRAKEAMARTPVGPANKIRNRAKPAAIRTSQPRR